VDSNFRSKIKVRHQIIRYNLWGKYPNKIAENLDQIEINLPNFDLRISGYLEYR